MSLETALLSLLQVHVGHPASSPLTGDEVRRLLGYEQTSGTSVRLLVGLQLYGLVERSGKEYLLTGAALHLLETADRRAFQAGLQQAATLPPLLRELLAKYSPDLDSHELRDDLKGRRLPPNERRTLLKVLQDNQELLGQNERADALFEQFGRQSPSRQSASPAGAGPWLRSLPGRTANLTLATVVFVVSLVGAALFPGLPKPVTPAQTARTATPAGRQIPAPVAVVSVPTVQASSPAVGTPQKTETAARPASGNSTPSRPAATAGASSGGAASRSVVSPRMSVKTAERTDTTQTPATSESRITAQAQTRPRQTRPQERNTPATAQSAEQATSGPGAESGADNAPPVQARTRPAQTDVAQFQPAPQQPARSQESGGMAAAGPSSPPKSSALGTGRRLAALLYSQRLTRLWQTFSPGVQEEWGGFTAFRDYRLGGLSAYGAETRVVSEEVRESGGVTYYVRTATFERGPGHEWTLILGLNPAGQVVAFNIVAAGVLPGMLASAEH